MLRADMVDMADLADGSQAELLPYPYALMQSAIK
jgi:hypothetical protein